MKSYVILDDQSNKSLAKGELLDFFDVRSVAEEYIITSCSGRSVMTGRKAGGLCIQAVDGSLQMSLPTVIECDELPNNRTEIPTPNIARLHPHLKDIGSEISPLDDQAQIQLLIGRDLPEAHHVLDQVTGPPGTPFAQKMKLGWVIVGEVCLGKHHATKNVNVRKIYVNPDGRPSVLKPCPSCICVQEDTGYHSGFTPWKENDIGSTVFHRTKNDDEPGKSTEDKMFLKLMEKEFVKEPAAFERGHAEIAPPLKENEECWYLPVFGVYHPKKPSRIRCVFDSAAKFRGTSLNDVLMTGPDLNNSLHVFGNSPSPAVAIYGLQKTAEAAGSTYGEDVTKFVQRHFYQEVMSALPGDDISQDLKDMDFDAEHLPLQRSLGLYWDLQADIFTYRIAEDKPFTRRGVLSTVNSIYDPLGFAARLQF
nr:uncharacterized protein LOC113826820 [Penaeus vannamei]